MHPQAPRVRREQQQPQCGGESVRAARRLLRRQRRERSMSLLQVPTT